MLSVPSHEDGLCFVETKNLDGETNLKPRKALNASSHVRDETTLKRFKGWVDSEPPNPNLYTYNGVLHYPSSSGEEKTEPITPASILLRGCSIRNTPIVIALIISTGPDTKIMLNQGGTPSKRSKIEKETNFNVVVNFVVLIAMCTITAVVSGVFEAKSGTSSDFFEAGSEPSDHLIVNAIITFA